MSKIDRSRRHSIAILALSRQLLRSNSAGAYSLYSTFRSRSLQKPHTPALEHCRAQNFKIGQSVVDRGGHVLISMRDDGSHHVIELAERKNYRGRIFRQKPPGSCFTASSTIPRSQGLKDTKGVVASLGGVPIKVGDDRLVA